MDNEMCGHFESFNPRLNKRLKYTNSIKLNLISQDIEE